MGLDVYLYRYENKALTEEKENKYEQISEANWNEVGDYDSLSDEAKDSLREKDKAIAFSLGLDEWGDDKKSKQCIEIVSDTDPKHHFRIGYFRSGYNEGGINRILSNLRLMTLDEIFNPEDEYCFQPNWRDALSKCEETIKGLTEAANVSCFKISNNIFSAPNCTCESEAISIYLKELERQSSFDGYSNINGYFYPNMPLRVKAIIHGTTSTFSKQDCSYVIIEGDNQWYINALKIVKETIEYVMAQPDQEKYFLHWSS